MWLIYYFLLFFFFKQKTAYELRISDWSSDVCSSDLGAIKLDQSTTFEDRDGQWRPLSGTDSSLLLIKKTDKKATYDWDKGVATWSGDVKPERAGPVKLQPGDVDALLLNLELARDVQAGEPLDYSMVDDGRGRSEEHV